MITPFAAKDKPAASPNCINIKHFLNKSATTVSGLATVPGCIHNPNPQETAMPLRIFLFRTAIVAVAMFGLGYVGHQLLLGGDYVAIEPIMRDRQEMMRHMPFALLSSLIFSAAFVWIYGQSKSARPWLGQGVRFGIAVWAISTVPLYLTNYTIEPWPGIFVAKILAWELVAMVLLGIVVGGLSRNNRVVGALPAEAEAQER
jgi:hypothetical protein